MKLILKQRLFSWFDSYDIYDDQGEVAFIVEGKFAWGHCLHILNSNRQHIGTVKQVVLTLLPKFELFREGRYIGCITKELSLFKPRYNIDYNGWHVSGNFMEWDYSITDTNRHKVATVSKELLRMTDTYVIDVADVNDALGALMVTLVIDAEKCSRN